MQQELICNKSQERARVGKDAAVDQAMQLSSFKAKLLPHRLEASIARGYCNMRMCIS